MSSSRFLLWQALWLPLAACNPEPAGEAERQEPTPLPSIETAEDGVEADWWGSVQGRLEDGRYQLRVQPEGGLRFLNPDHGLKATATPEGMSVHSAADGEEWSLEMRTVGIGRGNRATPIQPGTAERGDCASATLDVMGDCLRRLERPLADGVTAWWSNHATGLEQGWTFSSPVEGDGDLWIDVVVDGAELSVADGGQQASLSVGGETLRYGGLKAWDATDRSLTTRMVPTATGVRIEVDVEGATWPVVVDPTLGLSYWQVTGEPNVEHLDESLSVVTDVNGDGYDDIFVSARGFSSTYADSNRFLLFLGAEDGPAATAEWSFDVPNGYSYVGASLASAGDVNGDGYGDVVLGVPGDDAGGHLAGGAWVFHGSSSGLSDTADWSATGTAAYLYFGYSVTGVGDVDGDGYDDVLIGAPTNGSSWYLDESDVSEVFLYYGSATGLGTTADWTYDEIPSSSLGRVVSRAGDVDGDGYDDFVIGAPADEGYWPDAPSSPGIHLFLGAAAGPSDTPDWTTWSTDHLQEADETVSGFGTEVAGVGDVNSDGFDDIGVYQRRYYTGASDPDGSGFEVLVFHGSTTGLSDASDWRFEMPEPYNSGGGLTLAGAGDVNGDGHGDLALGAPGDDMGFGNGGAVRVFHGSSTGLPDEPDWEARGTVYGAWFGRGISLSGDVDGDGHDDLLVGSSMATTTLSYEGAVTLFRGSSEGLEAFDLDTVEIDIEGGGGQLKVEAAGDVNGDGFDDLVLASTVSLGWNPLEYPDIVYLFDGSSAGISTTASWQVEGEETTGGFGAAIAGAGDVDGDGYDDILIGAPEYTNGQTKEGKAYLHLGSSTGPAEEADWTFEGGSGEAFLGLSLAGAGDLDADGYDDVIVAAPDHGDRGRVYVFHGSSTGLSDSEDTLIVADTTRYHTWFGAVVDGGGDVNGDGYADIAIASDKFGKSHTEEGAVHVHLGSADGVSEDPDWSLESNEHWGQLGSSAAIVGDVDGDGYDDLLVGSPLWDGPDTPNGVVELYSGSSTGLGSTPTWTLDGDDSFLARIGQHVQAAGDVNGDGLADVMIRTEDVSQPLFLHLGTSTGLEDAPFWVPNLEVTGFIHDAAGAGDLDGDGTDDVALAIQSGFWVLYGHAGGLLQGTNQLPVARDNHVLTDEDSPVERNVLLNDFDPEQQPLSLTSIEGLATSVGTSHALGSGATVLCLADGACTYDPAGAHDALEEGAEGTDVFIYTLTDPHGDTATAEVLITITGVNDAPAVQDDVFGVVIGGSNTLPVLANDVDVDDGLDLSTLTVTTQPSRGTVTVDTTSGTLFYQQSTPSQVSDHLSYQVCDVAGLCAVADVQVDMYPEDTPPEAHDDVLAVAEGEPGAVEVMANDVDPLGSLDASTVQVTSAPAHGSTEVDAATGAVTYRHDGSETTADSFDYTVCNGQSLCDEARVQVEVTPVNDAPLVVEDRAWVRPGDVVDVYVLDNDLDPEGGLDEASLAITMAPAVGTTELDPTGPFVRYVHDGSDTESDSWAYEVCDVEGECAQATVTMRISETPPDSGETGDTMDTSGRGQGDDLQACGCRQGPASGIWLGLGFVLFGHRRRRR